MEERIQIRMLGRFAIVVDGTDVIPQMSKSKKGLSLLQYLILQEGAPVPNQQLCEVLWASESSSNPESALKTLISRLRTGLAQFDPALSACIATERNSYRFHICPGIGVDLYEFQRAMAALNKQTSVCEADLPRWEQAIGLYGGDLLADGGYQESWATPYHIELHGCYLKLVYRYIDALKAFGRYEDIAAVCRKALAIDAYDERLHIALMDAMMKRGHVTEALMQYRYVCGLYYQHLGMPPTEGIQEFYKKLVSAGRPLERLHEESRADAGAFVCEYAIFKGLYSWGVRSLEQMESSIFLVFIALQSADGRAIDPARLSDMMAGLREILRAGLRRCDIVSQCSASQFALLLPMRSEAGGEAIIERVRQAFGKQFPRCGAVLTYRVSRLDQPLEGGGTL